MLKLRHREPARPSRDGYRQPVEPPERYAAAADRLAGARQPGEPLEQHREGNRSLHPGECRAQAVVRTGAETQSLERLHCKGFFAMLADPVASAASASYSPSG